MFCFFPTTLSKSKFFLIVKALFPVEGNVEGVGYIRMEFCHGNTSWVVGFNLIDACKGTQKEIICVYLYIYSL